MSIRKKQKKYIFVISVDPSYKYLGITLSEYLDFNVTANVLAGAAGRALSEILAKFKEFGNVEFESNVATVSEYASEVWGYGENVSCERYNKELVVFILECTLKPLLWP